MEHLCKWAYLHIKHWKVNYISMTFFYIHTLLNQSQWVKISKKVKSFWEKPHSSVNLADFQNENQFDYNSKNLGFWSISLVNISISINLLFLKMIAERRLCALLQTFKSLVQLNILHRSQPHVWRKQFSSWGSTIFSKVQIISLSGSKKLFIGIFTCK